MASGSQNFTLNLPFAFDLHLEMIYSFFMTLSIQESKEKLRGVGLKSTTSRIAVLQYLESQSNPISHSDLVQALQDSYGDQATLYRNLLAFVQNGLARIVSNVGGIARYELVLEGEDAQHVHPHFACNVCGNVSCLPKTTVITHVDEKWRDILHHSQLQFVGECLECSSKKVG